MNFVLVITGPTASGKTAFAIECARRYNGEIVSCDSMQIYKNLDIGTAKPTIEEVSMASHHMIDVVDVDKEFSVEEYVKQATVVIDNIISRGKLPIIVGGTGLYINCLLHEYSFANTSKNIKIRQYYETILKEKGKEYLHSLLSKVDSKSALKIHQNDTKRVIRALEIYDVTGVAKSQHNTEFSLRYNNLIIVLNCEREVLYDRIDKRVDEMFDRGLLDEFEKIVQNNIVAREWQSMQSIGYKELFAYKDGLLSFEEVKELIKKNSRNYAKRQLTFFRGMDGAVFIDIFKEKNKAFTMIENALNEVK